MNPFEGGTDLGPVEIPLWIDLLAVFVAGIATSLVATRKSLDLTGAVMLVIVGALGGSIIRDTIIQRGTPAAFTNSWYLITAVVAGGIGLLFARQVNRVTWLLVSIDAVSLGLYTMVGVLKGLQADLPVLTVILLGVISGIGGGMLRDMLLAKTPDTLLPGAPYAILSVVGATLVVVVDTAHAPDGWLWWIPVGVVVALRFLTLRLGWQTPEAANVPTHVQTLVTPVANVATQRIPRPRRSSPGKPPANPPENPDGGSATTP